MDLHFRHFIGITSCIESANATALRKMKDHVCYRCIVPRGSSCYPVRRPCVAAEYVAAVMGDSAWLVKEKRVKTVRCGDGPEIHIIYNEGDDKR